MVLCVCASQVSEGVDYAQKVVDMPDRHALKARAWFCVYVRVR